MIRPYKRLGKTLDECCVHHLVVDLSSLFQLPGDSKLYTVRIIRDTLQIYRTSTYC